MEAFGSLVQHILNTLTLLFLNIEYEAHTELECMSDAKLRYTGHNSLLFSILYKKGQLLPTNDFITIFLARKQLVFLKQTFWKLTSFHWLLLITLCHYYWSLSCY